MKTTFLSSLLLAGLLLLLPPAKASADCYGPCQDCYEGMFGVATCGGTSGDGYCNCHENLVWNNCSLSGMCFENCPWWATPDQCSIAVSNRRNSTRVATVRRMPFRTYVVARLGRQSEAVNVAAR